MNTKRFLSIVFLVLILLAARGIQAQQYATYNRPVPLMDYVPQEIGVYDTAYEELTESDCRGCHGNSLADRHHATPTVVEDGLCLPCHALAPGGGISVTRDCLTSGCHSSDDLLVNGWHHDTDLSDSANCVACHDPNLIARISPVRDLENYPASVVTPSPFSCENCHWEQKASTTGDPNAPGHPSTYDHQGPYGDFVGFYEYLKPIHGSFDTHHMGFQGNIASACYRCHALYPSDPSWSPYEPELIRYCEICHDIASLHAIVPHVQGTPGWVASGFHVDSDVPTDVDPDFYRTSEPSRPYLPEISPGFAPDEMCMGCHGDTITASAPSAVAVPVIDVIQPTHGVCGAIVALQGASFGVEPKNGYHIQFEVNPGNWMALPIYSWTSTQVEFQVPCWEVGPGNYKVRVQTPAGESNQVNFTVENVSVSKLDPEAGPCGTKITLNGIGFGNSQSGMLDDYYGIHHVVDVVSSQGAYTAVTYTEWTDTSLKVVFGTFFKDLVNVETQQGNFIRDSIGEPLVQGCGYMGLGLWSVYLKTIYFGDDDGSGGLTDGDTIFQVVTSNPDYFELVCKPVINLLSPARMYNHSILQVFGRNFGSSQLNGEVRIGSENEAQSPDLGEGLPLGEVQLWSNTLIKVNVDVPQAAEGAVWFVWVEKPGLKSNYESLEIYAVVANYTLSVLIEGQGSVMPPGGSFEEGTTLGLIAEPSHGWEFSHWTDGVQQSVANPLTLTMNSNKAIKAVFVEVPVVTYTLNVGIEGEGSVTKSPPCGSYEQGAVVELLATASSGWEFSHWTDGVQQSAANPLTLTMNSNKAVKAVFVEVPVVTYTLNVGIEGEGSVTKSPPCGSYEQGTVVKLLGEPGSGWTFSYWNINGQSSRFNPLTLTMNSSKAIKAVFVEAPVVTYTLNVVTEGEGSVTPSGGSYEQGTVVELLATASSGWDFSHWTDGVQQSAANPLTLTMNSNKAIKAVFVEDSDVQDTLLGSPGSKESLPSTPSDTRDGNNDGIIDAMQDNVVSLKTSDGQYDVTIESLVGTVLSDCVAVDKPPEADGLPSEGEYPYGFFSFGVENVDIGGKTTVTIYLPEDASPTIYYKYGAEPGTPGAHWYEFMYDEKTETGAVIDGNKITLYFVDGDRGDDDLQANGTIMDQGGPGSEEKKKAGCFISTMASGFFRGGN
jgi:hypothetical protein